MYRIEIENECSCFEKSNFENNMTFETRQDMLNKARVLECRMNQEFCMTHFFEAVDYNDKIIIHSSERPVDDDDDDIEDIRELMSRNPTTIVFNANGEPPKGSR